MLPPLCHAYTPRLDSGWILYPERRISAARENETSLTMMHTGVDPSIREGRHRVSWWLRRIRDWPDPNNPYSPLLCVSVVGLFVLAVWIAR